jgi:hypothetical protein
VDIPTFRGGGFIVAVQHAKLSILHTEFFPGIIIITVKFIEKKEERKRERKKKNLEKSGE